MVTIEQIREIRAAIRQVQKPSRYEHTLGVAYTAACMAFVHGGDPLEAELAGILHDCAKGFSDEELIRLCREDGISLSEEEIASPQVIHAVYGKHLAATVYGIRDKGILDAIAHHTTGRAGMSVLEKIIFTADFIEPLRNQAPDLEELRKLAFKDLDLCVYRILKSTVDYLQSRQALIVPATLEAYEYYKQSAEARNLLPAKVQ